MEALWNITLIQKTSNQLNLFLKDTGSVFDYTLDPTKPGLWCSWADQSSNEKIEAENEEEGSMIVPTSETVKQSFFLKIALELGIPLGIGEICIWFSRIKVYHKFYESSLLWNVIILFYIRIGYEGVIGESGVGKSFLTNSFIRRLSKEKFITNVVNFSARTNVNYTQVSSSLLNLLYMWQVLISNQMAKHFGLIE